ncbi:MAG: hypothetical protein QN173_08390 [Armatimonadota bacterium]|nr:hypothetical protein [Armatimonadota bacterium]MDR7400848.1 hypothetical protein [Armatimonadota bacterium]MDR7404695.1 hypothetical protein [Armatimonadota bacterium]MDR7437804.1 hypothetical protein [Armatimonadota bacterium]MDR7473129.1 hypothetical protein [Armatimonadota bacterium]
MLLAVAGGLLTFTGLLVLAARQPALPRVGDHWHARYAVVVCGRERPPFPPTPGNVHTHGDGLIHIHPVLPVEAGRNATLGRFFASAGVRFSRDALEFPDGTVYRTGDRCPDGRPGRLRLLVNGRSRDAFDTYVPQDGDTIEVRFGPDG